MPKINRRHATRRDFTDDHKCQLASGFDYFGSGWSDPCRIRNLAVRDGSYRHDMIVNWPSPEVLEEMRRCWEQHGEEIKADFKRTGHNWPTWGELVFECGMDPAEALCAGHPSSAIPDVDDEDLPEEFRGIE